MYLQLSVIATDAYVSVFTARRHASAVYAVVLCQSVCPSVCLSVTRPYCLKTAKRRITQATPHGSSETLEFLFRRSRRNSNGFTSNGAPNARGVGLMCDFWQIACYNLTGCSADAEGPRDAPKYEISHLKRHAVYEYHFLLVAYCCKISVCHRFRDITTIPVYGLPVTLRSPSPLTIKFKSQAAGAFQFMCEHTVVKTRYISWVMGVMGIAKF